MAPRDIRAAGELVIYGDIGFEVSAADVSKELKEMGEAEAISVRINSFGGDFFDGLAIYQRLVDTGAEITVHVDGIAASAASVIAMAGSRIVIARAGTIMIHDAWLMAMGNAGELRRAADRAEAASAQMAQIYVRRTGRDMAEVRALMAAETEMGADQAIELGFATEVARDREAMAAKWVPGRHHFKRVPRMALGERAVRADRMIMEMRQRLGR